MWACIRQRRAFETLCSGVTSTTLMCTHQGVVDSTSGYMLSDPALLTAADCARGGSTNLGLSAARHFLDDQHACGETCAYLGN